MNPSDTPDSILARFATEFRNPAGQELRITFADGATRDGSVRGGPNNFVIVHGKHAESTTYLHTWDITRIDYSNARYRGAEPLYERKSANV